VKYLLDSNAVVSFFRDARSKVAQRLKLQQAGEVGVSSIVLHELFYGAFHGTRTSRSLQAIEALQLEWVEFELEDARASGEIRTELARKGTPIGPYDVLIAGQARVCGLILVTHNVREFSRVPGLQIEDWEA
jgi:tRNA(fMet)-specific endonuclease VapC